MHSTTHAPRRLLTRLAALGAASLAAIGFSLGAASPALAHDELVGQAVVIDPADGSVTGITLNFSNDILHIGTEIHVTNAAGDEFGDGVPTVQGREVTQRLKSELLTDGESYQVAWRVVSSDGHPIQGVLSLYVAGEDSAISTEDARFEEGGADNGSTDGTDSEAADDHSSHQHDDDVTTQESQGTDMSTWVAIALALAVAGGAFGAGVKQQRRKRQASASASGASGSSNATDASAGADAPSTEGER